MPNTISGGGGGGGYNPYAAAQTIFQTRRPLILFMRGDKIFLDKDPNRLLLPIEIGQDGVILDLGPNGEIVVEWTNGKQSLIRLGDNIGLDFIRQKKVEKIPKNFNFDALDKLVIGKDVKEEIVSVLKQHQNSKKIFEDWGLNDVLEYGKGMTFMFYGPPGTGKTWAAKCIAKCSDRELLSIGAAEIQTSEPGGANRNIQNAFAAAKDQDKVLFIDECDSLITNRNVVGMIIGGEINTLLTEIEKFEGICILATNRIETLDEALERRISLIVEFPEPSYEQREDLWKKLIPKKMPVSADVKVGTLAEHKLTGGQIKNCILQAARLAVASDSSKVELKHIEAAISRVQKSKSLMGTASRYHEAKIRDDFRKG